MHVALIAAVFLAAAGSASAASSDSMRTDRDHDEPVRFRIEVNAPRPYEKMLEQRLPIVRWQSSERVTMPLLERLIAEAKRDATEALAADGYFSADVRSTIQHTGAEALVRLQVTPGPRTRVESVDLDFAGAALNDVEGRSRIEAVKRTWELPPGEAFRDSKWVAAKQGAVARLGRGRYVAAKITESEAKVVPEKQAAYLRLKFDSGPVFRAGRVNVFGLERYPPSVVRNFNPHRRGEPYDAKQLALFQRRLLETGYFNAVHFSINPHPDQSAAAPLNVRVIEAPSQRLETGISVSSDTGLGLKVDYADADLANAAWRLRSLLDLNQREQRVNLRLDGPPRPGGVWSTYGGSFARSDVQGLLSREVVLSYGVNWGLLRVPSRLSVSAHFERQGIAGSGTENNYAVFPAYRATFRTTEELVTPREGLIGSVEVGASIPGLSSQEFARVRGLVNWLIPWGLRNDFLVRGELGAVIADSRFGIPSSFLFRAGGDQSLRGYAFESIGVPQGEAIVGGRYLAIGSVDYTRWMTDSIGAAVFVDTGDAFDELDEFDPVVGVGIGGRWKSPIGPLRADIAYGERARRVRLHFSVGYTF